MIDLRSDTVTQPCSKMRKVMSGAPTGDDVYGEDPTVNSLECYAAKITNKEAALFVTSGTQSNLVAILSHCQRGHEYITGSEAHTYLYEGGGAAVLGGIQPNIIPFNSAGELPLELVEAQIKPDDYHYAISRLVCLENTQAGKVLSQEYLSKYSSIATKKGLKRHLDGARIFNAAVKLGIDVAHICSYFDTVSICLSKGLGAPMGSILVGDLKTIKTARRWRKMLGGGLRQAGIVASAGLYALENNISRLKKDHDKAEILATALQELDIKILEKPQTNMVILGPEVDTTALRNYLAKRNIRIAGHRLVIHKDISDGDIEKIILACSQYKND